MHFLQAEGKKYSLVSSNVTWASNTGTGEIPLGLASNGKKERSWPNMIEETLLMDQAPKAANIVTGFSVRRPCSVPEPELKGQRQF